MEKKSLLKIIGVFYRSRTGHCGAMVFAFEAVPGGLSGMDESPWSVGSGLCGAFFMLWLRFCFYRVGAHVGSGLSVRGTARVPERLAWGKFWGLRCVSRGSHPGPGLDCHESGGQSEIRGGG